MGGGHLRARVKGRKLARRWGDLYTLHLEDVKGRVGFGRWPGTDEYQSWFSKLIE